MGKVSMLGLGALVGLVALAVTSWHFVTSEAESPEMDSGHGFESDAQDAEAFESFASEDSEVDALDVEDPEALVEAQALEGQIEFMLDHMFGSIEEAQGRFDQDPTDKDAILRLLMHYTDPSENVSAEQRDGFLIKAVRANPTDRDLLLSLAAVYQTEARLEEGLAFFESLKQSKDYPAEVDAILSDFYVSMNEWDKAIASTLRAAERGGDPLHEIQAAFYLIDEGRLAEAKACLDRAESELAAAKAAAKAAESRLESSLRQARTDEDLERIWKEKIGTVSEISLRYGSNVLRLTTEFQILRARIRLAILEGAESRATELYSDLESRLDALERNPEFDGASAFVKREREKNRWLERHLAH